MSTSKKPEVIRAIFFSRWDVTLKVLSNPIVTLTEVSNAIAAYNLDTTGKKLSTRNPANFMKDIVRNVTRANENWPADVLACGYTARQHTGDNNCFEFIPLPESQTEAFPTSQIVKPSPKVVRHPVESPSMPLASRRLGRTDESWLLQVVVRLRIVETHLSLFSNRVFVQVDLLQMNVKQAKSEIDALFLAINEEGHSESIVTLEAKGRRDDILTHQIVGQVKAVFRMQKVKQNTVIPTAAKNIGNSQIHFVQFAPVNRVDAESLDSLVLESEAVYELKPPVPGIS